MDIRCAVVGDGLVGKTSLITRICKDSFNHDYVPTVTDNILFHTEHQGKPYSILFIDTAGQEEYDRIRVLSYEKIDIFLLCFSVINHNSFENIEQSWFPELAKSDNPNAKTILVGTKSDLRNDLKTSNELNAKNKNFVQKSTVVKFAKRHNMEYVECSALTKENLDLLLKTIMKVVSQKCQCCLNPVTKCFGRIFCISSNND